MRSFASWITRHRKLVVVSWILVLFATGFVASTVGADFKDDFKLPESDSQRAYDLLTENFPAQSGDAAQIVFHAENGLKDPAVQEEIAAVVKKAAAVKGVSDVVSPLTPEGAANVAPDGKTAFATISYDHVIGQEDLEPEVEPLIDIAKEADSSGLQVKAGGEPVRWAQQAEEEGSAEMVGLIAAMIILFIMFGTFLAMGMPIITAVVAVGTAQSLIILSSNVFSTADFATFLSIMIGLGVGIDYALFIVTRFRQGLRAGVEPREAVITAMDTAGRAVMFAGITVVIALLGLFLVGISFLNGPAVAASVTVLLTMIGALTLLPALLTIAGPKINDPFFEVLIGGIKRNVGKFSQGGKGIFWGIVSIPLLILQSVFLLLAFPLWGLVIWLPTKLASLVGISTKRKREILADGEIAHPRWHRWAEFVHRHPIAVGGVATVLLLVLVIPAFSMDLGSADAGTDPADKQARQAYDLLAEGFGPGFNAPLMIVTENTGEEKLAELSKQIDSDEGVAGVAPVQLSPNEKVAIITAFPTTSPQSTQTNELVQRLRSEKLASLNEAGTAAHVAGVTAIFDDFSNLISEKLPFFIGAVVLLSALLLLVVFRSIAIPIKAVVMNLLGIFAAFGVVVAVFQWGWAAGLIGVDATAPIIAFLPVMMFAIVFGLSMDYEVFLMSRVHEEWEHTGDAEKAVVEGVASTGGVITAAAVIMISLFGSFAVLSGDLTTKLFGVGLATTIFLDAFVIRVALVPAVMALLGDKAWYLPKWLDRILPTFHVEPPQKQPEAEVVTANPVPEQS